MVCSISFLISIMFIITMIYFNIASYENDTIKNYKDQLPDNLKNIYDKICKERLKIYYLDFIISKYVNFVFLLSLLHDAKII